MFVIFSRSPIASDQDAKIYMPTVNGYDNVSDFIFH